MECRLQNSAGPWRCQILLRKEYHIRGNALPEIREEIFGDIIYNKSKVEEMLTRAQLAILNPSVDSRQFVSYDIGDKTFPPLGSKKQLQFSSNVVCLDIQSPDTANFSFIDLPGALVVYLLRVIATNSLYEQV